MNRARLTAFLQLFVVIISGIIFGGVFSFSHVNACSRPGDTCLRLSNGEFAGPSDIGVSCLPVLEAGDPLQLDGWCDGLLETPDGNLFFRLPHADGFLILGLVNPVLQPDISIKFNPKVNTVIINSPVDLRLYSLKFDGNVVVQVEGNLDLLESEVAVTGNLTLSAGRILSIRDSEGKPVRIESGGALTLQGSSMIDIIAINHVDSLLLAHGDLSLRSAAPVRGDVHYFTGGSFSVETLEGNPAALVSPYDPIILAAGNVALGDYTGASLHIVAGGSVVMSSAVITGTDTTANTINPANNTLVNGKLKIGDLASVSLPDGSVVNVNGNKTPTLDVRAGVDWNQLGGAPNGTNQVIPLGAVSPEFEAAAGAAITVTGVISVGQPGGLVLLTNYYQQNTSLAGDIATGDIHVQTALPNQNGGAIRIASRDSFSSGALNAYAETSGAGLDAGNGGSVVVLAPDGMVATSGDINTYSRTTVSGAAQNGGTVVIQAGSGISINNGIGDIFAGALANSDGNAGNGGVVDLFTKGGNILLERISTYTFAAKTGFSAGSGGVVNVHTDGGWVRLSSAFSPVLNTSALANAAAGSAGDISITAAQGITITQAIYAYVNGSGGRGANVALEATGRDINVDDVLAFGAHSSAPGSGGTITLQADNGGIRTGDLQAFSNALVIDGMSQNGGSISLFAGNGSIETGKVEAFTVARGQNGSAADGGSIVMNAVSGGITTASWMQTFALTALNNGDSGPAGSGGDIILQATGPISITGPLESYAESPGVSGTALNAGQIAITTTTGSITTLGNLNAYSKTDQGTLVGNGGRVLLSAADGVVINQGNGTLNTYVSALFNGDGGSAGNVTVKTSGGDIALGGANAYARGSLSGGDVGNGGEIFMQTSNGGINIAGGAFGAILSNTLAGSTIGNAGAITLTATAGITVAADIQADASGINKSGGNIWIETTSGNVYTQDIYARSTTGAGSVGPGGKITILAYAGEVRTGDLESYSNALLIHNDSSDGGAITLLAGNGDVAAGRLFAYSEARGQLGDTGRGGDVVITATLGTITTTGGLRADANAAVNNLNSGIAGDGGNVHLYAGEHITITGGVQAASLAAGPNGTAANAGSVILAAQRDIQIGYVDARAFGALVSGDAGEVVIDAGEFFRATDTIFQTTASIAAVGLPDTSTVTIRHGGKGIVPFTIGDPATNGITGTITTGDAVINPTTAYLGNHFESPNIWIVTLPLEITKMAAPASVRPGELITYTMVYTSFVQATNVVITDNLPVELTNLSVTSSGAAISPAPGSTYRWSVNDLLPGTGGVITVTGVVSPPLAVGWVFTNTATLAAAAPVRHDQAAASAAVVVLNGPPLAVGDNAAASANTAVLISVLDNDSDPNGDNLVIFGFDGSGSSGSVSDNGNGVLVYDPDGAFDFLAVGETAIEKFTYTIQDTAGLTSTAVVTVTVNGVNDAPVIANNDLLLSASVITETGTVTLNGEFVDLDASDTHTVTIDWGDGSQDIMTLAAGVRVFDRSHQYLDDNPSGASPDQYTISVGVSDPFSQGAAEISLLVNNAAPQLSNLAAGNINENSFATLSGDIADIGGQDTFTLTVDWGDGSPVELYTYPAGTTSFSENHQYLDDAPAGTPADVFVIAVALVDDDAGQDAGVTTVLVSNTAPILSTLAAFGSTEGGTAVLDGSITDLGVQDTFTLTVDWGDGSPVELYTYPAGTTSFSENHQYLDDNPTGTPSDDFVIALTLTDDDTGQDTGSIPVTITNSTPTVNAGADLQATAGMPVQFSGSFSDAGAQDTHELLWDFGDGSTQAGTLVPSHTYADAGVYTATLRVTDDDTGVGVDSLLVFVQAVADLHLTKTTVPGPVISGLSLGYTLAAANNGPSTAHDTVIVDTLPDGVVFESASPGCTSAGKTVTCLVGDLPSGSSTVYTITAKTLVETNGIIINSAAISSAASDPNPGNNAAAAPVEVVNKILVYENDFENGAGDEWCFSDTTTAPRGETFLGELSKQVACLSLEELPEHTQITLVFDLYIIRSWDGNQVEDVASGGSKLRRSEGVIGPDRWRLFVDGGAPLIDTTFTNWVDLRQAYPGSYPGGDFPARTGASEVDTLGFLRDGFLQDAVYHFVLTFDHSIRTLSVDFDGQPVQDIADESWGLDNVQIYASAGASFQEPGFTLFLPLLSR